MNILDYMLCEANLGAELCPKDIASQFGVPEHAALHAARLLAAKGKLRRLPSGVFRAR